MIPYTDYTVRLVDLKRAIVKNPYDPNLNIDGYMRYLKYNTPSAQPERKKGKWERHYTRPNVYADLCWHCSVCGYENADNYVNVYYNYCPNCGADMRERKEE